MCLYYTRRRIKVVNYRVSSSKMELTAGSWCYLVGSLLSANLWRFLAWKVGCIIFLYLLVLNHIFAIVCTSCCLSLSFIFIITRDHEWWLQSNFYHQLSLGTTIIEINKFNIYLLIGIEISIIEMEGIARFCILKGIRGDEMQTHKIKVSEKS